MDAITKRNYSLAIVFATLIFASGSTQADGHYMPAKEHHKELSVDTIIKHNTRLLTGSSIGISLKDSTHREVKSLYKKAQRLFYQARRAQHEGQDERAKNLSYQSIGLIYQADRIHYRL